MTDRKACVRCGRRIDGYARICPFCNWDQNETVPPPREETLQESEPGYVPPADRKWMKPVLGGAGAVLMVIIMFAIGTHIHGSGPATTTSSKQSAAQPVAPARPAPRANVTLVPDDGAAAAPLEQPITSAPAPQQAQGVPTEYQRTDATALSSDEYAQMAKRAAAEKQQQAASVDPRTLRAQQRQAAAAAPQTPAAAAPAEATPGAMTSSAPPAPPKQPGVVRTRPIAEYQPLPELHLKQSVTAVLDLVIGADGYVKEVNVRTPIPGDTAKLIEAVQRWRFKPATENGVPVEGPFSVSIAFNADE